MKGRLPNRFCCGKRSLKQPQATIDFSRKKNCWKDLASKEGFNKWHKFSPTSRLNLEMTTTFPITDQHGLLKL